MTEALLAERYRNFYNPTFDVRVGGVALEPDVRADITEIVVQDSLNGLDAFELRLNNWSVPGQKFKYLDTAQFDPPKEVDVSLGYYGQNRVMVRGEITTLDARFSPTGENVLHVRGLSLLHRFRREQRTQVYERKTVTQIARDIAGRLGVDLRTDAQASAAEEAYDYVLQDNQYDIVFVLDRARRIGYDLVAEREGGRERLYFGPAARLPVLPETLRLGQALQEFQIVTTSANQTADVRVRGWDYRSKRAIEGHHRRGDVPAAGSGPLPDAIGRGVDGRREVIVDRFVATRAEARTLALAAMDEVARKTVVVKGTTIGFPELCAGVRVDIDGVGPRFSRRYLVFETLHRLGPDGYRTQFSARMEAR